jgi:hypothetical protein
MIFSFRPHMFLFFEIGVLVLLLAAHWLFDLLSVQMSRKPEWWEKFFYGGLSCQTAACVTNPIDVTKVRLQLQGELQKRAATSAPATVHYRGFLHGIYTIAREEGPRGLYRGLTPSLLREGSYSTIRLGAYDPVKEMLGSGQTGLDMPLWKKIVAGGLSGSVGAAIANPTDLVKVRMQAMSLPTHQLAPNAAPVPTPKHQYKNTFDAFATIFRTEGLAGLYRGVGPTTQRAMILTASQLPSYDHSKHMLLASGWFHEGLLTHCSASIIAGMRAALLLRQKEKAREM